MKQSLIQLHVVHLEKHSMHMHPSIEIHTKQKIKYTFITDHTSSITEHTAHIYLMMISHIIHPMHKNNNAFHGMTKADS
jgi:hypothetical protein